MREGKPTACTDAKLKAALAAKAASDTKAQEANKTLASTQAELKRLKAAAAAPSTSTRVLDQGEAMETEKDSSGAAAQSRPG